MLGITRLLIGAKEPCVPTPRYGELSLEGGLPELELV
jgi:hypothetical protein